MRRQPSFHRAGTIKIKLKALKILVSSEVFMATVTMSVSAMQFWFLKFVFVSEAG